MKALAVSAYPTFTDVRLYFLSVSFIAASIIVPFILHQFNISGQIFLPLYFFSLLAGLGFGLRCGFLVGLLAPLASFTISGMPLPPVLPFVLFKSVLIGTLSGVLIEKGYFKNTFFTSFLSVITTQILGSLVIFFFTQKANLAFIDTKVGFPGLILQLLVVPFLVSKINRWKQNLSPKSPQE